MKKRVVVFVLTLFSVAGWTFFPHTVRADVEWKVMKDIDLKTSPLDVAPSMDGKWLYILTPGEVLIFSTAEGVITNRIPVDREFDRIAPLPRPDVFSLASSTKKTLQVIFFETIYKIDLTDLPVKGPQDALVTLVVFDDYQ